MKYTPASIEPKWQAYWEKEQTFLTPRLPVEGRPKLYVLDMFPYPSANGLHVGHPEGYTATDIVCRFERMNGTTVLHPMGWDAFGLPAEQQAKKTGVPPRTITEANIEISDVNSKCSGSPTTGPANWQRSIRTIFAGHSISSS